MGVKINRLSALKCDRITKPGMYADGGNLFLQVKYEGVKSWVFRYRLRGRKTARDMGLGSYISVTLEHARRKAAAARAQLADDVDPLEARRADRAQKALDAARVVSFKEAATRYIDTHKAGWRNEKHAAQWLATLEAYAFPTLGRLPVAGVDVGAVIKVLEAIWLEKPETAGRVRGRIEAILDWAKARGYRTGENPARWKGNLDHLLPARSKVRRVEHHAALAYVEIGAFTRDLREQEGNSARALEFLILTCARTSEVLGATWDEIDFENALWTVPAHRIKAGKEHRVPLSSRALAILKGQTRAGSAHLFPGGRPGRPLSNMALLMLLGRMDRDDLTAHGFRSTFRDWCAERTNYPNEVAEMALAHTVGDKVEAAYRRGDLFDKRRRLMADWAKFCNTVAAPAKVINIREKRKSAPAGRR